MGKTETHWVSVYEYEFTPQGFEKGLTLGHYEVPTAYLRLKGYSSHYHELNDTGLAYLKSLGYDDDKARYEILKTAPKPITHKPWTGS